MSIDIKAKHSNSLSGNLRLVTLIKEMKRLTLAGRLANRDGAHEMSVNFYIYVEI